MYKPVGVKKSRVACGTYKYSLAFGEGGGAAGPVAIPDDVKDDDYHAIIALLENYSKGAKHVKREWKTVEVRHVTSVALEHEELAKVLTEKNHLVQQLDMAKKEKRPKKAMIRKLALEAAEAEGKVAEHYETTGEKEKAVVNMVSQASLLSDAGKNREAVGVLERAKQLTAKDSVKDMIDSLIDKTEDK
jgi:hypothetical protein